jgi:hypothetical protein
MAKRDSNSDADRSSTDDVGEDFVSAITDQSKWIAGYPPWHAEAFLVRCKGLSRDQALRLLHAKRAIEDGNLDALKQLLSEGVDGNSTLPWKDGTLLQFSMARHQLELCELLLDAGANAREAGLIQSTFAPGFETLRARLLAAGADPNKHFGGQSPIVCAAMDPSPGAAKTLNSMIEIGMDVNGTATVWPDNKTEVRRCTGLMTAAWRGKPAMVKLLLSAGADVHRADSRGNTALDWARNGKSKSHEKVIQLLQEAGAKSGTGIDLGVVEIPNFRKAAKSPAFKDVLGELGQLTAMMPEKIELEDDTVKGAAAFLVDEDLGRKIIEEQQANFLSRGAYIFLSQDVTERNGACIVAVPTTDRYEAIAAIQTNGANSGVTTAEIITWLKNLEKDEPFQLSEITPDLIRGRFQNEAEAPLELMRDINKLCPDGDTGEELTEAQAKQWASQRMLFLWWD